MTVIIGVVTFPGSLDDRDAYRAVALISHSAVSMIFREKILAAAASGPKLGQTHG